MIRVEKRNTASGPGIGSGLVTVGEGGMYTELHEALMAGHTRFQLLNDLSIDQPFEQQETNWHDLHFYGNGLVQLPDTFILLGKFSKL